MLIICSMMVFGMVILGGLTRLTGSGLSIVDWQPFMGALPPLTHVDWQALFERYQTFPEFHKVNSWMSLSDFKNIFWLEYTHRLWGRLVGLIFLAPILYSAWHKSLRQWAPHLMLIWLLGGLQGLMGWYMVKSGLIHDPWVSPYRLTAHLLLALVILGTLEIIVLRLLLPAPHQSNHPLKAILRLLLISIVCAIAMGGFVAGHHAGLIHNTFPDMSGEFIPSELWALSPLWRHILDNPTGVQFLHRVFALTTVSVSLVLLLRVHATVYTQRISRIRAGDQVVSPRSIVTYVTEGEFRRSTPPKLERRRVYTLTQKLAYWTVTAIMLQALLGIATLLWVAPVTLAVLHQAWAIVVFLLTVWLYYYT